MDTTTTSDLAIASRYFSWYDPMIFAKLFPIAVSLLFLGTSFAQTTLDTTTLCGNALYCIYDGATPSNPSSPCVNGRCSYGNAPAAKAAFLAAVGTNQIGQDNFSGYPTCLNSTEGCNAAGFPLPGDFIISYAEAQLEYNATIVPTNPPFSGGLINGALGVGGVGSYFGFDYASKWCSSSCTLLVSPIPFDYAGMQLQEPPRGFIGVISNNSEYQTITEGIGYGLFIGNLLWVGGTGTATNPMYPDNYSGSSSSSQCISEGNGYLLCLDGFWVELGLVFLDPATTTSYTYETLDGSLFTSIAGLPSGFAAPFDISSGNTDFGLVGPGQTLTFPNNGVQSFSISGINPAVDGTSPTAFPVGVTVTWNGSQEGASIQAIASSFVIAPSQVAVTASGLAYSRVTRTFNGTVTITNIGTSTVSGPFEIVFSALTNGVTLVNATGTYGPTYYLDVPSVASLAPGQSTTVSVQFNNPSNGEINFTPVAYLGAVN